MKFKFIWRFFCLILLISLCVSLAGCRQRDSGKAESGEKTDAGDATREITYLDGKKFSVPAEVERIAASGAMNQIVYMLGGADKLVATAEVAQKGFFPVLYPRIKQVPAAYTGGGPGVLSMEALLKADPQVVLSRNIDDNDAATMESANMTVFDVRLNTPQDIKDAVLMIGRIIGSAAEEKAERFSAYYGENIRHVSDLTSQTRRIKVFVASSGGGSGPINTAPNDDMITFYIQAAGGTNIAAEKLPTTLADGTASVDFEFLNMEQPDVIIAQNRKIYEYILDPKNGSQWQFLDAVKKKKVYINPKGVYLWSVRSAEGALEPLWLAKTLHPEIFKDLDIRQKVRDFYKDFYYYDLSEKELDAILEPRE